MNIIRKIEDTYIYIYKWQINFTNKLLLLLAFFFKTKRNSTIYNLDNLLYIFIEQSRKSSFFLIETNMTKQPLLWWNESSNNIYLESKIKNIFCNITTPLSTFFYLNNANMNKLHFIFSSNRAWNLWNKTVRIAFKYKAILLLNLILPWKSG